VRVGRQVADDHTVSWDGHRWDVPREEVCAGLRGAQVEIVILSPLNSNVILSPHETGDIHIESEGTAASERHQRMHRGRYGVCQNRRTPRSERAPN
jgi:hypothetical protein